MRTEFYDPDEAVGRRGWRALWDEGGFKASQQADWGQGDVCFAQAVNAPGGVQLSF